MVFPASYFQTYSISHDFEQFTIRLDPVGGGPNPSANRQANEKKENEEGSENNNDNDKLNSFPFKDSDVICAKVREVSRKPDKIYGIIERLVGSNSKKLELFARNWNVSSARRYQNWVCIGNQIQKTVIMDDEISKKFDREYPEFAPAATKSKE